MPAASPVEQRASHGNGGSVSINVAPDERLSAPLPLPQPEGLATRIGDRAPYVDGAAATSSLTGAVTQLASTSLASGFGAASGGLWTAGAIMAEVGNRDPAPVNWIASGANALNGGAGLASGAAALTTGETQTAFGYTSAAAWGASAVTSMAHAWFDTSRNRAARGFQALSGLLNVAAAGLSAKAVQASSENDTGSAAWYGGASSVAWGLGALSAYASIRAGKTPTAVHPENNAAGRSPEAALSV
ncbi:hypothetical protein EFP18_18790 [Burkholderia glumae]|uniref:hypothetical protein n=1 Tax=Burkholderia glumae TaxID=337 RepID=UPI0001A4B737|nr:hypothetical protein [Burkholderia glumae]ACR30490.1 Hypothetical protein bglu_1g34290 [Burkholderia glumae BGR1]QHE11999.1 hypothetical protein GQR88_09150 [Burkholderia glumae AU6208]KHJ60045.1 hypothetical protein NCPPB3923_26145 [Burkholderia glumae]MCR1767427.1 hypothetical protein [Burkholderia glumae]NVE23159.1 hypothetical protein [Burkholderia glumae]